MRKGRVWIFDRCMRTIRLRVYSIKINQRELYLGWCELCGPMWPTLDKRESSALEIFLDTELEVFVTGSDSDAK